MEPIAPPSQCPACGYDGKARPTNDAGDIMWSYRSVESRGRFYDGYGVCLECRVAWHEVELRQARERIAELGRQLNEVERMLTACEEARIDALHQLGEVTRDRDAWRKLVREMTGEMTREMAND